MRERFIEELKKVDVAKLTSDMIKIPSYSFMENQEQEIAQYIYDVFQLEGIESELVEIKPGRYNVYGRIAGGGKGRSLMLSGHIDTVPAYDMAEMCIRGRATSISLKERNTNHRRNWTNISLPAGISLFS